MRTTRSVMVTLDSALDDDQFEKWLSEITETIEQASCDYAAACDDDKYEVRIVREDQPGEDTCHRCGKTVTSQVELIWIDGELRNDCPESEDGAPHEPYSADLLGITIEKVADEDRVMVLVGGFQWGGKVDASGAGDATFANEREAIAAFVEAEFA